MSIDIAAEIKFSFVQEGEYLVRLQDADQTIIGKVIRDGAGWIPQYLDGYFENHTTFATRYMAARPLLEAYELANGLRDSEGRRVGRDPETKGYWVVLSPIGTKQSPRWTDKADAIAHLASLQPGVEVDFEEVGREAALQDQSAAPALNPQVRDAIAGREVGDPENVRIMEAFSKGYQAVRDEQAAKVLAGPKTETEIVAQRFTRAAAERYIASYASELGDTVRWNGSVNVPIHVEWNIVRAGEKFNIVSTVTPREIEGLETPASEDDGFKLGVVAPEDWEKHDHQRCIEAGEHRGSSRHTKAECTGIVDRPTAEEQLADEESTGLVESRTRRLLAVSDAKLAKLEAQVRKTAGDREEIMRESIRNSAFRDVLGLDAENG